MRRTKKCLLLSFGLVIVFLMALAFVLLVFEDEDYRRLAIRAIEFTTDYGVAIDGPFKLEISSAPFVSAEIVRLESRDDRPSSVVSIGKFSARMDLRKLIFGTLVFKDLDAEDVFMSVVVDHPVDSEDGMGEDGNVRSGDIDLPVFEKVRLRNIRLDLTDSATGQTLDIHLKKLDIDDTGNTGPMFVSGEGTIAGQFFDIDGRMGSLVQIFKKENGYPVECTINLAGARLTLSGTFENFAEAEGMALSGVRIGRVDHGRLHCSAFKRPGYSAAGIGPVSMDARIGDGRNGIEVEIFKITGGTPDNTLFVAQGTTRQLAEPEALFLKASFESASQPWINSYLGQNDSKNVVLKGEIEARKTTSGIDIEVFRIGTADGKLLNVSASGAIPLLPGPQTIDIQLDAGASDPFEIGSILGVTIPKLKPVAVTGRLGGQFPDVEFNGNVRVDDTNFSLGASAETSGERPRIFCQIVAKTVDLDDLGMFPGPPPSTEQKLKSDVKKPLFGNTPLMSLAALRNYDLVLNLDADKLIGRNIAIEEFDLDVRLENGRLHVHPASLAYSSGFTEMDFIIDASGEIPRFAMKIVGEDIDIDDILAYAHEPIILSGSLSMVTDLRSSGHSMQEIASNLNGVFGIALENGQINRIINLLAKDAFDILLTSVDKRTYTEMNCLVNKIDFENGIGTIEILFLDSPQIRAKGTGVVNLVEETLDVVINPQRKRSLIKRRSAVRINGSLAKPSAFTLPLAEAAELYSTIALPFVSLPARGLGHLWSILKKDSEPTPCIIGPD